MLFGFFEHLRRYSVPVSITELIDLLGLFERRLLFADQTQFYFLARLTLVKNEKYYDRFDRAFASYFDGIDTWQAIFEPKEGLLQDELKRVAREIGRNDADSLLEGYRTQLEKLRANLTNLDGDRSSSLINQGKADSDEHQNSEPAERDKSEKGQGHNAEGESDKSDSGEGEGEGDGGDSGEGEGEDGDEGEGDEGKKGEGDDGEEGEGLSEDAITGERFETTETPQLKATKVWLEREFADYDPDVELGTRNLKMALRRLRRWAREAADVELDLADTIHSTAANGGLLDIKMVREKRNAVKVLMFFDVGGSMDEHIERCAQLFSAAKSEFKYLEFFYFHNFIYESVWQDNERRAEDRASLWHVMQRYPADYKIIIVGDADMGRHEISERGGSVEYFNAEPGEVWLARMQEQFRQVVWLNPVSEDRWKDSQSIQLARRLMEDRMYFLSETGLAEAMKYLMR
ncbi:MAG: hypothetical protein ACI8Z1_004028 [Candidatus Azotimanducaceae bacterium]|jgi:uncharacterized protein with von Willebrand factor type A (vWA) domain